jgi:hypothetical protein
MSMYLCIYASTGAELLCEESVMKALELDIESLDGHQTLVSLRLSQSRNQEACHIISIVYTKLTAIRCLSMYLSIYLTSMYLILCIYLCI